jgi:tetratricopeptide (TPR) repeat protein
MKKIIFLSLVFLISLDGISQGKWGNDSVNCITNLSLFREYYKQKNYEDAVSPWRWVYKNCPQCSGNIYKNGPTIIKSLMKSDPTNKSLYVDTLMQIYDQRIKFFGKEGFVLGRKGSDLINYDKKRFEEAYNILKKSFELEGNDSEAGALSSYMKAATYMQKNSLLEKSDIVRLYTEISTAVDFNLENNKSKSKYYLKTSSNIESLFTPYANCSDLISIFSSKFTDNSEDVALLKKIIKILESKECTNDDLYFRVSSKLYELEPSALSASKMGKMCIAKKEYNQAIKYCKEAVELEDKDNLKSKYFLILADAYRNSSSFSLARSAVYSSLELKKGWGEAYISLGNIYVAAATSCGNSFEQKTVYWVAVDAFRMASKDGDVADKARRNINTYSKYFPSTEECFFNNVNKEDTYKVSCWINQSTKVRAND